MTIIIGLGNPGTKFNNTRHNVGFMAIDKFAEKNNFPEFKLDKKSNSLTSEKNGTLLSKPQTFMNDSGKAVKQIIKNKQFTDLTIVHDDIDLPVGKIKIIKERGSAGHKGVESIIKAVGNKNLIRLRIGIASQSYGSDYRTKAKKIVLKNFSKQEQKIISQVLEKTTQALEYLIKNGLEKAMNEYNK